MTTYDYLMLDESQQAVLLANKGENLMSLDKGGTFLVLYSLSNIFVELEFEKWTNRLVGRAIFQSGKMLDKYLAGFDPLVLI